MDFFFAKWIGCGFGLAIFSSLNSEFVVVPLSLSLSLSFNFKIIYLLATSDFHNILFYFIFALFYFI